MEEVINKPKEKFLFGKNIYQMNAEELEKTLSKINNSLDLIQNQHPKIVNNMAIIKKMKANKSIITDLLHQSNDFFRHPIFFVYGIENIRNMEIEQLRQALSNNKRTLQFLNDEDPKNSRTVNQIKMYERDKQFLIEAIKTKGYRSTDMKRVD